MNPIFIIGQAVALEWVRRKETQVPLLLMGVFLVGVLGARVVGIENPATGTFLLNLGLTFTWFFAHVLVLLISINQVPAELENRTLYLLLARPVSRGTYLFAKWLAGVVCAGLLYVGFTLLVLITVPQLESYSTGSLGQMLLLQLASLAVTGALAQAFSLLLPRALGAVLLGLLLFGGSLLSGVIRAASGGAVAEWLLGYLPAFGRLNLTTRYTDGVGPLSPGVFFGLLAYAIIFVGLGRWIADRAFARRPL